MIGLARSSFYYKPRNDVEHPKTDAALVAAIRKAHERFPAYGYRRLAALFRRQGLVVNAKRLRRILRMYQLSPRPFSRRWVKTTQSAHGQPGFPNLLAGRSVSWVNQVWVADITYVRVGCGFAYGAIVLDVYSRKVVGWALSRSLHTRLCSAALEAALARRRPAPGCIHHSDHGVQYTSAAYVQTLQEAGFVLSMASKGCSWENGYAESFFKTLKYEEVLWQEYETEQEAIESVRRFIEEIYNEERLHSGLGYRTPNEFEQELENGVNLASRSVINFP